MTNTHNPEWKLHSAGRARPDPRQVDGLSGHPEAALRSSGYASMAILAWLCSMVTVRRCWGVRQRTPDLGNCRDAVSAAEQALGCAIIAGDAHGDEAL
jgi:hypothetical protein